MKIRFTISQPDFAGTRQCVRYEHPFPLIPVAQLSTKTGSILIDKTIAMPFKLQGYRPIHNVFKRNDWQA
jgi:hypothetical protein